ncbi:MAG: hypothetical protein M1828_000437 [Chrysothrix sp. TS-e1954]|nr:MAG: hypothetical protein M1828_000437 [Chrysothrix sp. TS-e1954]
MAGTSPRRSSRAKAVVPAPNAPLHSSNSSSMSSSKADRNKRTSTGHAAKAASATPASSTEASSERELVEDAKRQTRKKPPNAGNNEAPSTTANHTVNEDHIQPEPEEGEEGGQIRCLCRKSEYPGPPVPLDSNGRSVPIKDIPSPTGVNGNEYSEEAGGLFISCDSCMTWQHGGCVGIFGSDMIPKDDYYCWRCRKEYHKVLVGAKGRRYSKYLPVTEADPPKLTRKQSMQREPSNRSAKDTAGKATRNNGSSKGENRRSTMNSRSAWDEDEILRRALEESKGMSHGDGSTNGTRKGKRGRDESNEANHTVKRLKTNSDTGSSQQPNPEEDSEGDEQGDKSKVGSSRRPRGTTSQTQQDMETRRMEKLKERERQEAANKRKGRAERRRADDSEPPEDTPKPTTTTTTTTTSKPTNSAAKSTRAQQSAIKQPFLPPPAPPQSTSHRKITRPTGRKGKVGRNQYTRDRDALADARADSTRLPVSRDGDASASSPPEPNGAGAATTTALLSNGSKPAKPRHMNLNRTSMNEIRKRAAGIFEYLSSTQIAMAGAGGVGAGQSTPSDESSPPRNGAATAATAATTAATAGSSTATRPRLLRGVSVNGASKLSHEIRGDEDEDEPGPEPQPQPEAEPEQKEDEEIPNGGGGGNGGNGGSGGQPMTDDAFRKLSSRQMMDVMAREIVQWQGEFGKYGEK